MCCLRTELEAFLTNSWPPMPPRLLRLRIQTLPSLPAWSISADGVEPARCSQADGALRKYVQTDASRADGSAATTARLCQCATAPCTRSDVVTLYTGFRWRCACHADHAACGAEQAGHAVACRPQVSAERGQAFRCNSAEATGKVSPGRSSTTGSEPHRSTSSSSYCFHCDGAK